MKRIVKAGGALAIVLMLAGCFESKQALIAESESATPVRPGTYISSEQGKEIKVSIDGTVTNVTEIKSDGKSDVDSYLARPLGNGFFVVMDRGTFRYGLIKIDRDQIVSYDDGSTEHCIQLEELAFAKDVPLSKLGVSGLEGNDCMFSSFDGLALAFNALIDANKMPVQTTFTRKLRYSQAPVASSGEHAMVPTSEMTEIANRYGLRDSTLQKIVDVIRDGH